MIRRTILASAVLASLFGSTLAVAPAWAQPPGKLSLQIKDQRGEPVDDAVVTVFPTSAPSSPATLAPLQGRIVMDQVDETFEPNVLVITPGTSVHFPNHDDVRHHVYSFSEPKTFELPLYEGLPANPVVFDQAGIVVLGCNIHDWMRGYVYVASTRFYTVSVAGRADVLGLAPGTYRVEVWHSRSRSDQNWTREVTIGSADAPELAVDLTLKPALKIRRAPKAGKTKY